MKLIIATDPNGGIGYQNRLPWDKIQGDLPRFKQLTQNSVVFMGRNTWDSLPIKPLPKRINFVVSSRPLEEQYTNAIQVPSINLCDKPDHVDYWLIGGAKLIESYWKDIEEVHLTKTFAQYTCDTFINLSYLESNFEMVSEELHDDHSYQIWKRTDGRIP